MLRTFKPFSRLKDLKEGDVVKVVDWSYSVTADTKRTTNPVLDFYTTDPNVYEIIKKGRFKGAPFTTLEGKRVGTRNNLHVRNVKNGKEYFVLARFCIKNK